MLAACSHSSRLTPKLAQEAALMSVTSEGTQMSYALSTNQTRPLWVAILPEETPCAEIKSVQYDADANGITVEASADKPSFLYGYLALPEGAGLSSSAFSPQPEISLVLEPKLGLITVGAYVEAGVTKLEISLGAPGANKEALSIPQDAPNSVSLAVVDSGGPQLSWEERNIGDYDMNGTVGVTDITPLAMFFNDVAPWDAWHDAVDGDGSGDIKIADVTPIAIHFANKVTGYRVMRHADGAGDWTQLAAASRPYDPSAAGQPKARPPYTWNDTTPIGASFYAVQPADGEGSFGISSNVAPFSSPVSVPPAAPPIVNLEPPPDTLNLALGEVAMLADISTTATHSLPTSAGQEYLAVLTCGDAVVEGLDPIESFNVAVSYEEGGTSSVSSLPPMGNKMWSPLDESAFLANRSEQEREIVMSAGKNKGASVEKHPSANVDDTRSFNIVFANGDMGDIDGSINARCASTGPRAELWIDDRDDDNRITPTQLAFAQNWLDTHLVALEEATYGNMMLHDGSPTEDPKLTIVFTQEINKLIGLIGGMFVANDLQATATGSNICNAIYLQVPDPSGLIEAAGPISIEDFQDQLISTPAHELQHLINFSNRLRSFQTVGGTFVTEDAWVNEGLSHFTEDFTGFQSQNNFVSPDFYLVASPWVELPGGNTTNPTIFRRGAGYLFMRYLDDRYGDGVLDSLLQENPSVVALAGTANVEAATSGANLTDLLLGNGVAMYAAGLGLSTGVQYHYAPVSVDAVTTVQHGVNFRGQNASNSAQTYMVGEPLAYALTPGGPSSRTYTARKNALLFIRLMPGTANYGSLTITAQGSNIVQAAVVRIDSGEVMQESAAGDLADGGLVMGNLAAAGEEDHYTINQIVLERDYIFRVIALTSSIDEFEFRINGGAPKPNHAYDPDTMSGPPPGVYQLHTRFTSAGPYNISIKSVGGVTGEYYLLVIPSS
jgi:hypothetical protein